MPNTDDVKGVLKGLLTFGVSAAFVLMAGVLLVVLAVSLITQDFYTGLMWAGSAALPAIVLLLIGIAGWSHQRGRAALGIGFVSFLMALLAMVASSYHELVSGVIAIAGLLIALWKIRTMPATPVNLDRP